MKVAELIEDIKAELLDLSGKIDNQGRMRVALKLNIALATVTRYLEGDVKMTNIELAEQIVDECNKILSE